MTVYLLSLKRIFPKPFTAFSVKVGIFLLTLVIGGFLSFPDASSASSEDANKKNKEKTHRIREGLLVNEKWTGDYNGMVQRKQIRVLVAFSKTNYFLDKARQRGVTYEVLKEFEKTLNKKIKKHHLKVEVLFIPVPRDQLMPALIEGRGDLAAASLTITPEREKVVGFTTPLATGVDEVLVTGPNSSKCSKLSDLSGKEIYVRASSSYHESLLRVNESFKKSDLPPIKIIPANEYLEAEDLLEMVNAGLIPATVVDSYLAEFWSQIFDKMILHPEIPVNKGGRIAWMIRKNNPEFRKVLNDFVNKHKIGTLFGNIMFKRYLKSTKWVQNPLNKEDRKRFDETVKLFQKYAGKYGLDWLLVAAQAYQESKIDQNVRSPAGAVGVMQLLPTTAAGNPVNIQDIEKVENNIHAGVKYLRFIIDKYYKDEKMDVFNKALFAFASYNAGPSRISTLRRKTAKMGLNPNIWFDNVEVAAAKDIGRETVQYVRNIFKYYIAYTLILEKMKKKEQAKKGRLEGK